MVWVKVPLERFSNRSCRPELKVKCLGISSFLRVPLVPMLKFRQGKGLCCRCRVEQTPQQNWERSQIIRTGPWKRRQIWFGWPPRYPSLVLTSPWLMLECDNYGRKKEVLYSIGYSPLQSFGAAFLIIANTTYEFATKWKKHLDC